MFKMVFADSQGNLYDHPWSLVGRLGDQWVEPLPEEMIPLPEGASLTMLPGRIPLGMHRGQFKVMSTNPYHAQEPIWAVGALLPQGYTRTLLPGFTRRKKAQPLPLLGYAAVGFKDGQFYVAALPTDEDDHWNPKYFNTPDLEERVKQRLKASPHNRVLKQLAHCALEYSCYTAQNIFYRRWEGGLPSSPRCNAQCLGCISLQPSQCCPSPQKRLDFVPDVEELVEIGREHLTNDQAIISFGQGCEGEPTLQAELLAQAITEMRRHTPWGTINVNTNAGFTAGIKKMVQAGLDAMRVSIISPNPEIYEAYYQPRGYQLQNVRDSLKYAAERGVHTALNLLTFPGVTDREEEVEALLDLVTDTGVKQIQIRNLNIDPDFYLEKIPPARCEVLGIPTFLEILAQELPEVTVGNYTKPLAKNLKKE